MDKNQLKDFVSGALVIDKPVGMTSHDVVKVIRHGTNIRRAGHTGTRLHETNWVSLKVA